MVAVYRLENSLLCDVTSAAALDVFQKRLKSYLFTFFYPPITFPVTAIVVTSCICGSSVINVRIL